MMNAREHARHLGDTLRRAHTRCSIRTRGTDRPLHAAVHPTGRDAGASRRPAAAPRTHTRAPRRSVPGAGSDARHARSATGGPLVLTPLPNLPVTLRARMKQSSAHHLVIVGDSLGAGHGDPVQGLELVGWADRLAVALQARTPPLRVCNLARIGRTTEEIAREQCAQVPRLRPAVIVVCAGGNDMLQRRWQPRVFRQVYMALLQRLMASGARVITTTWHDVPRVVPMQPALARHFSERLAAGSGVVRGISRELGMPCIDFWYRPALLDAGCYSRDRLHPNALGYLRLAGAIAAALSPFAGLRIPQGALYTRRERCQPGVLGAWRPHSGSLESHLGRPLSMDAASGSSAGISIGSTASWP